MIKVAFDIDGVVVNFNDSFLRTAHNVFNTLHGVTRNDVINYNYWECLDISKDRCFDIVNYVLQNPIKCNISPITGSVDALTKLSKHMDLLFITARRMNCAQQTYDTVHSFLPNIDKNKIKIIHMRGSKKHEILKEHGIKYFVDDKLTTCLTLKKQGIKPILFDSPWNQSKDKLFRVNSWNELSNFIFEKN